MQNHLVHQGAGAPYWFAYAFSLRCTRRFAQTDNVVDKTDKVTLNEINAVRAAIDSSESLDDAAKTAAKQSLDQAAFDLQSADAAIAETTRKCRRRSTKSSRYVRRFAKKLRHPPKRRPPLDPTQPLAALQQSLVTYRTKLDEAEKALADAAAESSRRQSRLLAIPDERAAAKQQLDDIQQKLTDFAIGGHGIPRFESVATASACGGNLLNATLRKTINRAGLLRHDE